MFHFSLPNIHISAKDRATILLLLLEIAFQHASLYQFLHILVICMKIPEDGITFEGDQLQLFLKKLSSECGKGSFIQEIALKVGERYVCLFVSVLSDQKT